MELAIEGTAWLLLEVLTNFEMRKSNLRQNHKPFDQSLARYRSFMEKIINAQRVTTILHAGTSADTAD